MEMAETYEREARLLRELRDQAVDECSRSRVALAELQVGGVRRGVVLCLQEANPIRICVNRLCTTSPKQFMPTSSAGWRAR